MQYPVIIFLHEIDEYLCMKCHCPITMHSAPRRNNNFREAINIAFLPTMVFSNLPSHSFFLSGKAKPKKIEHHLSVKFIGIGCQTSRGLSDIHSALEREVADTLSTIPGCLNSNACNLTRISVPGCNWTALQMTRRAVVHAMEVFFSLLVKAVDSASQTDDVDEKSEAVLFQMQYVISTGQFRISLHGVNSTADRSSFKHLSSNITCNPGFVKSIDKTGCGKQQKKKKPVYISISIACATQETKLWLSPSAK